MGTLRLHLKPASCKTTSRSCIVSFYVLLVAEDGNANGYSSDSQVLTLKKIQIPVSNVSKSWHHDVSVPRMQQVTLASFAEHLHDPNWFHWFQAWHSGGWAHHTPGNKQLSVGFCSRSSLFWALVRTWGLLLSCQHGDGDVLVATSLCSAQTHPDQAERSVQIAKECTSL